MSSKENQETSPTDTTSAPSATPQWSLDGWLNDLWDNETTSFETTTVKCSECKIPTLHEWGKIKPRPTFPTQDMIMVVSKSKRLTLCTQCGLVKTIT